MQAGRTDTAIDTCSRIAGIPRDYEAQANLAAAAALSQLAYGSGFGHPTQEGTAEMRKSG